MIERHAVLTGEGRGYTFVLTLEHENGGKEEYPLTEAQAKRLAEAIERWLRK